MSLSETGADPIRWAEFLPADGPPLQAMLEQDPEFFEQTVDNVRRIVLQGIAPR
jgi:hypothetical protein